jgi:hypothetical protein
MSNNLDPSLNKYVEKLMSEPNYEIDVLILENDHLRKENNRLRDCIERLMSAQDDFRVKTNYILESNRFKSFSGLFSEKTKEDKEEKTEEMSEALFRMQSK